MHLCLFEDSEVFHLAPVVQTRGVYQFRTGAFTNLIRLWETFDRPSIVLHSRPELARLIQNQTGIPVNELPEEPGVLFVNGRVTALPHALITQLQRLNQTNDEGRVFLQDQTIVAAWVPQPTRTHFEGPIQRSTFEDFPEENIDGVRLISRLWHLIDGLQPCLQHDLSLLMQDKRAMQAKLPAILPQHQSITLVNPSDIFISPEARIHPGTIISAADGPVYIDQKAQVMEGAIVKGPMYLGQNSVVKARADVSKTTLGPVCKAGGEVTEAIFQSFSNKAHEGFLGHAYIGSWCNIGAGTNASNLKNDYNETTLFNESLGLYEKTGRQFLGVIMADYSKIGISSMVNTASVLGVGCNLFGSGFLPRHLPSFTWGSPESGFEPYRLDKAFEAIRRVAARRNRILSSETMLQLEAVFQETHNKNRMMTA